MDIVHLSKQETDIEHFVKGTYLKGGAFFEQMFRYFSKIKSDIDKIKGAAFLRFFKKAAPLIYVFIIFQCCSTISIVISLESSQSVSSNLMQRLSNMEILTTKAIKCTCGSQFRTKPERHNITCYTESGTKILPHDTKRCPKGGCQKGT